MPVEVAKGDCLLYLSLCKIVCLPHHSSIPRAYDDFVPRKVLRCALLTDLMHVAMSGLNMRMLVTKLTAVLRRSLVFASLV